MDAGFCKRRKPDGKKSYVYEFNGSGKYLIKRIFERKIMPYVNITPEKFLETDEVKVFVEFSS